METKLVNCWGGGEEIYHSALWPGFSGNELESGHEKLAKNAQRDVLEFAVAIGPLLSTALATNISRTAF